MSIEARSLDLTAKFYIVGNNDNTGVSFNPDIGPEVYVSSTGTGSEATIITTTPHGFNSGDQIMVTNSNSIPLINGLSSITVTGTNSFFINDSYIVVAGTQQILYILKMKRNQIGYTTLNSNSLKLFL